MLDETTIKSIIDYLEKKVNLTELEKDILDSVHDLKKYLADRNTLIARIVLNKGKYKKLISEEYKAVTILTGQPPIYTPYENTTTASLQDSLSIQISILCSKL